MSSATTIALVVSAVVAAGSAAYSGYTQSEAADEQAKLLDEQAKQEQAAAQSEADIIREKGRRLASTQSAALAASGVQLDGQGSGNALLTETKTLAERDALAAITGGTNKAKLLEGEAKISKDRATSSLVAGGMNTASTLLGGYNSYQKSKQPGQQAANMELGTSTLKSKYTTTGSRPTLLGG